MSQMSSQRAPAGPSSPMAGATGTGPTPRVSVTRTAHDGTLYVDWKDADNLRRYLSPNGKMLSRRRLGSSAHEQRLISQAIKRARAMALLPYTSATI